MDDANFFIVSSFEVSAFDSESPSFRVNAIRPHARLAPGDEGYCYALDDTDRPYLIPVVAEVRPDGKPVVVIDRRPIR